MTDANYCHVTDPMVVDWVELGCRGWQIDESGAELIYPDAEQGPHYAHLDYATLDLLMHGDGAFLRRVYFDLVAANVPGTSEWTMTTYPRTATTNVVTAPLLVEWWVSHL